MVKIMKKYQYVRLINGEILKLNKYIYFPNAKYGNSILDILETGDLAIIKYLPPDEDKCIRDLFKVYSIYNKKHYIIMTNQQRNFIIKDDRFIQSCPIKYSPTIKSIITREKLKSIEYEIMNTDIFDTSTKELKLAKRK